MQFLQNFHVFLTHFFKYRLLKLQKIQFLSTQIEEMVGCKVCVKSSTDNWLNTLLLSKFFGSCGVHQDLRKNEKNVFCIDCSLRLCRHCMTSHCLHTKLQICKYVYHDVVRLQEIQKHLDCSKIQTYKINGEKAVHLNPRPQSKDAKPSTKAKFGASCEACGKYLQDMPNRYCSIACKASVVSVTPKDHQSHKFITVAVPQCAEFSLKGNYYNSETNMSEMESSSISLAESSEEMNAWVCSALKPRSLLHKRKGIPHRAPLC